MRCLTAKCFSARPMRAQAAAAAKIHHLKSPAIVAVLVLAALTTLADSDSLATENNSPSPQLTVVYAFLGEADGALPFAGVTLDPAGNLYGTTAAGGTFTGSLCGSYGCGVAFKIDGREHESVLYSFSGSQDGAYPESGLLRDSSGQLYGNSNEGGSHGAGTVFKLQPEANVCARALCPWNETVLHSFGMGNDGVYPSGDLIRDAEGNLYGVTSNGGSGPCASGCGTVFKVDPEGNETVLWNFAGPPNDGAYPYCSLFSDRMGNLYGTTYGGGNFSSGTVFELTPTGSGWTERVIYNFTFAADGWYPFGGVISDAQGNLYGTTSEGGSADNGVVFKLSPGGDETVLHSFTGPPDGAAPGARLLLDGSGNLYGTTPAGGTRSGECSFSNGCGTVFELSPNGSGWTERILWNFTGGADGSQPTTPVVMDAQGNLYGTTRHGGDLNSQNPSCFINVSVGCGVVFQLAP